MNMRTPQVFRKRTTSEDSFVVCISDLMAGLLSIFILTLIYYIISFSQATDQLTENDKQREIILVQMQNELKNRGIEVNIDIDHGVLRLPEGILFDVGQAEIKEKGIQVLGIIGPVLLSVLDNNKGVETIFVEGHTDSSPIKTSQFPSNWELSAQRAINTWNALVSSEAKLAKLQNAKKQPLFSCSGYAETRPVKVEDNEKAKQENRRIDFRFSMTPPQKSKASSILAAISKVSDRGKP